MKNIGWIFAFVLMLVGGQQAWAYKIVGRIEGVPDDTKVYLSNVYTRQVVNATQTKNGCFTFKGKAEEPFYGDIETLTTGEELFRGRSLGVFVENMEIQIETFWMEWRDLCIKGSHLQDQNRAYRQQLGPLYRKQEKLMEAYMAAYSQHLYDCSFKEGYIEPGIEIVRQQKELSEQMTEISMNFVKVHPSSLVSLEVMKSMLRQASNFTVAKVETLVNGLAPELRCGEAFRDLEKTVAEYRETARGQQFIDFQVIDRQGKEGMFSDYIQPGKYNMLECWASWCIHCRVEIPYLKLVQRKYGDRLNIIAVSCDRKDEEWKKAMQEDGAPCIQLRKLKDQAGKDVGDYYHFNGIPYELLIDGEGRIVTNETCGAALDLFLQENIK